MNDKKKMISDEEHKEIIERGEIATFVENYFKSLRGKIKHLKAQTEKRSREDMIEDAYTILTSTLTPGMKQSYFRDNFLPYYTKNCITEHGRGYVGNPYISKQALQTLTQKKNGKYHFMKDPSKPKFTLIHEHIVPKQLFYKPLLVFAEQKDFNRQFFEFLVDYFLIGVTITKTEDEWLNQEKMRDDMPDEFYNHEEPYYFINPWARYLKLQKLGYDLTICKVKWAKDLKSYEVVGTVNFENFEWVSSYLNYSVFFQESCHEWIKN